MAKSGNSNKPRSQACSSQGLSECKWTRILQHVDQLLAGVPACLKDGELQLHDLCCCIRRRVRTAQLAGANKLLLLNEKLVQLVDKLLAASKRPRDWKQPENNSSTCCSVLAASCAALMRMSSLNFGFRNPLQLSDVLNRVMTAQQQVAQLLGSPHAAAAADQQQQHAHQQQHLQLLACRLLEWWLAAYGFWMSAVLQLPLRSSSETSLGYCQTAVELSLVLAQTLTEESPAEYYQTVVIVAYEVFGVPVVNASGCPPIMGHNSLFDSPAFMQLALAMLLLHSCSAQQAVSCSSSSSSSSANSSTISNSSSSMSNTSANSSTSTDSSTSANSSTSTTSNSNSSSSSSTNPIPGSGLAMGTEEGPNPAQAAPSTTPGSHASLQEQLAATTLLLWQAAGFAPSALAGFTAASQQHADTALQAFFTSLAMGPAASSCSLPKNLDRSKVAWLQQPADSAPPALKGVVVLAEILTSCLSELLCLPGSKIGMDFVSFKLTLSTMDQLGRRQKQLLQAVVWALPQFLLLTALQHGGHFAVTRSCVTGAWWCLSCWLIPGLHAAAAAAASNGGAAAVPSTVQPLTTLLGQVLDCWLLLMQQLLLKWPAGLLSMAAAAVVALPGDSEVARQVCCGKPCSCEPQAAPPAALETARLLDAAAGWGCCSAGVPCITLECSQLMTVNILLQMLQPLGMMPDGVLGQWSSKLPGMLLLLETVARKVLPYRVICSESLRSSAATQFSNSTAGSSSSGGECCLTASGIADKVASSLWGALSHLLAAGSKQGCAIPGPLHHALLGSSCLQGGSELLLTQQQQQQQRLQFQFFSVALCQLKLRRMDAIRQQHFGPRLSTFGTMQLLEAAVSIAKVQANWLPPTASLAEVHDVFAPWVVLLGMYMREAATRLQHCQIAAERAVAAAGATAAAAAAIAAAAAESERGAICFGLGDVLASMPDMMLDSTCDVLALLVAIKACLERLGKAWTEANMARSHETASTGGTGGSSRDSSDSSSSSSSMGCEAQDAAPSKDQSGLQHGSSCGPAALQAALPGSLLYAVEGKDSEILSSLMDIGPTVKRGLLLLHAAQDYTLQQLSEVTRIHWQQSPEQLSSSINSASTQFASQCCCKAGHDASTNSSGDVDYAITASGFFCRFP